MQKPFPSLTPNIPSLYFVTDNLAISKSQTSMLFFNDYCYYFLIFLLAIFLLSQLLLLHKQKKKNLPPSPLSIPIIGHIYLLKQPLHKTLSNISNRFGPILYFWFGFRPVLVVSSASAAEECFTKNDIVFANRPQLLAGKHFGFNYTSLAWASYGQYWRNLRRITTLEIFSTHRINTFTGIRTGEVRLMIQRILAGGEDSSGYRTVEIKSTLYELTLNVMMTMIAGKRYYGENVAEEGKAKEFRELLKETFYLSRSANMGDFFPVLKWIGFKGTEKRMITLQKKRNVFFQELIEEKRRMRKMIPSTCSSNGEEAKKTLIDVLLSLQEPEPQYYTDEVIRSIISVLISAGTDTSIGTMEWAMSLLLKNPSTLIKAQAEIDNQVGHDRFLDESDLTKLPYLHNIILETLRMYPAAPMLIPHESSQECIVGGFNVPRSTMLLVNVWAIQNDPKIWEDPEEFKPERFEGVQGQRDGFKFMPFGSGRRGCPGESLAIRVMGLSLGSFLQCFEWDIVGEEMVDMSNKMMVTLSKVKPLEAKCRPRPTMVNLLSQLQGGVCI